VNLSAQGHFYYGVTNADGVFETALNCRACGCGPDGAENFYDRIDSEDRKPSKGAVSKQ